MLFTLLDFPSVYHQSAIKQPGRRKMVFWDGHGTPSKFNRSGSRPHDHPGRVSRLT